MSILLDTVLLAAGKSTRISAASDGLPKPLITIDNISILERNISMLSNQGLNNFWINTHYKSFIVKKKIGNGTSLGVNINYIYEPNLLGTAGAVKNLYKFFINNTVLVVYGDNLLNIDVNSMLNTHLKSRSQITIGIYDKNINLNTGIAGGKIEIDSKDYVIKFSENTEIKDFTFTNAGIYLINKNIINRIPSIIECDFAKNFFPDIMSNNIKILTYKFNKNEYCLGIDTPECLDIARKIFKEKIKNDNN